MTYSKLSLGTWTFAGDAIWSHSSEEESIRVIRHAVDRGILLFDTAPNYGHGRSERILGQALGNRDGVSVASKMKVDGLSPEEIKAGIERSLVSLNREAIDLMQIHWPADDPEQTSMALDVFAELKREGKIREIGVCNFGKYDLEENSQTEIVSNQLPYSLMWRVIEKEIVAKTIERRLPILAYSPLQQGLLSGRYQSLEDFPPGRQRTRLFTSVMAEEAQSCLAGFLRLAREYAMEPLRLAVAFALSRPFIDSLIVGARTVVQLDQLISASESNLPKDLLRALDSCSRPLYDKCLGNPDMFREVSRIRHNL